MAMSLALAEPKRICRAEEARSRFCRVSTNPVISIWYSKSPNNFYINEYSFSGR